VRDYISTGKRKQSEQRPGRGQHPMTTFGFFDSDQLRACAGMTRDRFQIERNVTGGLETLFR
jgi:hypothetical protein